MVDFGGDVKDVGTETTLRVGRHDEGVYLEVVEMQMSECSMQLRDKVGQESGGE